MQTAAAPPPPPLLFSLPLTLLYLVQTAADVSHMLEHLDEIRDTIDKAAEAPGGERFRLLKADAPPPPPLRRRVESER